MPSLAAKPCRHNGCSALVRDGGGYCAAHKRVVQKEAESRRESSTRRGYGYRWQKAREGYLRNHPLCANHEKQGQLVKATVVDHITPHKGDKDLFWDSNNWQPLCKPCHDEKTAREDGAFGNPVAL
jgi:5-methylcytosine-specific restriction protein A